MTETELAWAAGLFEGEGSIYAAPAAGRSSRSGRISLRLELHMTDEDVVRRFGDIVGVGTVRGPYRSGGDDRFRPRWKWRVSGAVAVQFLTESGLLTFLGQRRRAKAEEILAALAAQGPTPSPREYQRCLPGCTCRRHTWRTDKAAA